MKIENARAIELHVPAPGAHQVVSNPGVVAFFDSGRVRIEAACGSVGYGGGSADARGIGGEERGMAEARHAVL